MAKIKAFFYILYKSMFSTKYYREILEVSPGLSIKYYGLLCLLLSIIASVSITLQIAPQFKNGINTFASEIINTYPDDLMIKVEGGNVEINRPEPYFIDAPSALKQDPNIPLEHIIVIDSNGTIGDLDEYKSLALINDKNLLIRDQNRIQTYPLTEIPNGEITKNDLINIQGQINQVIDYIFMIIMLPILMIYLVYLIIFRSITLLILALLYLMIGRIKGLKLTIGRYQQIALHIITLPLIVETLAVILNVAIPVPFWFLVLNLVIGLVIIFDLAENQTTLETENTNIE